MRGRLSVRINDGHTDRLVTSRVRDLRFRKVAPGGHHSASMRVVVSRDMFRDLGPADKVYIYDARTGRTMWEGYTENPGVTDGPAGQEYDLSAMGGMVLASDESHRLIYIDRGFDQWRQDDYGIRAASATSEVGQFPGDAGTRSGDPALYVQLNPGQPIDNGSESGMVYDAFVGSSMTLGGFGGFYDAGLSDPNYDLRWTAEPYISGDGDAFRVPLSTTGARFAKYAGAGPGADIGSGLLAGKTGIRFRIRRTTGGATNVATDNVWGAHGEVVIVGQLVDRYGVPRNMSDAGYIDLAATAGVTGAIPASQIAEDLLGRVLTMCDPASAVIDWSSALIDQFVYIDGANARQVLDDLTMHAPDMVWEVLETLSNGKHRFNYRRWPTTPRYEISVKDGYNAPGGEVDLCNRIAVYWTDKKGAKRTTVLGASVPELGEGSPVNPDGTRNTAYVGRIRDAEPITLPDGLGSTTNAKRIGEQVLAAKANPPKAATATVRRPIVDHLTGNTVMPWEIEPGYACRVRETGDDLRMTEVEYVDTDGASTLTLGEPQLTIEQRIARLSGRR